MDEARLIALCEDLVERSRTAGAQHAEAAATWARSVETHIENSDIHTVQSSEETVFGLRVIVDDALGFVTANATDDATLGECVGEAVAQAKATPPDELNLLPDPEPVEAVADLHDERIGDLGVEDTTMLAKRLIDRVAALDDRVRIDSGAASAGTARSALVSSSGVSLSESRTRADGYLFGMAVDGDEVASFDYDGDATRRLAGLDAALDAAASRFVTKCVSGLGARNGESFKGQVVLSPETVGEFLLPNLLAVLSGEAVRKERSPLADKLGEPIASSCFTLIDDGTRAAGTSSRAFDREGVAVRRRVLIEEGVLKTFLYDTYEAGAAGNGARSTGHAVGAASSLPSIGPIQLELAAGTDDEASLLSEGPAVFVGRFSGSTNPVTGDFSGVVKNGALIGSGAPRPIKETTIAGNLFEVLRQVTGLSSERRLIGGAQQLPTMRIDGVSITAG